MIFSISLFAAPNPPSEAQALAKLRDQYAKQYPGETILNIESGGDPVVLETVDELTGKVIEQKYKIPFTLTAQRKSGTKAQFEVGVNYVLTQQGWAFSELGIGAVIELAGAGKDAPPKAEVKAMLAGYLEESEFKGGKVEKVLLTDGEFNQAGERFWYRYEGDYDVIQGGDRKTCNDVDFVIQKEGVADQWRVNLYSRGRCN